MGSEQWHAIADLEVVDALARRDGRQLGLVAKVVSLLPGPAAKDLLVVQELAGDDDEMIERALNEQLVLVGISEHRGMGNLQRRPRSRQRLDDHQHPHAVVKWDRGRYVGTELYNFQHSDVTKVRCGELLDSDGGAVLDDTLSPIGGVARTEARRLESEEARQLEQRREANRCAQAARELEEAAQEVEREAERERRYEQQRSLSSTFEGPQDYESDAPIEDLHHRVIRGVGRVIWEWWVSDGVETGGPMTREYGESVVRWSDGDYYYVQIGDGYHELTPLGQYERDWEAIEAGKRHSLYSDDERDALDEPFRDDVDVDEVSDDEFDQDS